MNKKGKRQAKFLFTTPLLLATSGVIAGSVVACNEGSKQELKSETKVVESINASSLGWSNFEAKDKISDLTTVYVFNNRKSFFSGSTNITKESDIADVIPTISGNSIILMIILKAGTYYNSDGQLGEITKDFNTSIVNFKRVEIEKKDKTELLKPINASSLGWSEFEAKDKISELTPTYIFNNLDKFFSGDRKITNESDIVRVTPTLQGNSSAVLVIVLKSGTYYNSDGQLGGINSVFSTIITGFTQSENKSETQVITYDGSFNIFHDYFGYKVFASEEIAKSDITRDVNNEFVFNHLNDLISGSHEVTDASQILDVRVSVTINNNDCENNLISLSFTLRAGTWYDWYGDLGRVNKEFNTNIKGAFRIPTISHRYQRINSSTLKGWNGIGSATAKLIFNNLDVIFSGNYKISSEADIGAIEATRPTGAVDTILVYFYIKSNTWYDSNGRLGYGALSMAFYVI